MTLKQLVEILMERGWEPELIKRQSLYSGPLSEKMYSLNDIIASHKACELLFGSTGYHCTNCNTNMFVGGTMGFSECCQRWATCHIKYYQYQMQQLIILPTDEEKLKYIGDNYER